MLIARGARRSTLSEVDAKRTLLRRFCILAIVVVGVLGVAPSARGAETIGLAFPFIQGSTCPAGTYVQASSVGNQYAAAFDGVITSWSHEDLGANLKFKVVRVGTGGSFTVLAEDGPHPQPAGQRTTNLVRIPVRQGDVIGYHTTATHCPHHSSPDDGPQDAFGWIATDVPAGGSATFTQTAPEAQISIEASLERDRDGDGFGDETQDGCPTNASTQGACPLPTVLGQTFAPNPGGGGPAVDLVVTNQLGVVTSAPADGVITSWSHFAGPFVDGTLKLKMYRPLGANNYSVVGADVPRTLTAGQLNTFAVRIPVRHGDRIGYNSVGISASSNVSSSENSFATYLGDLAPGSSQTFSASGTGRRIDLSAVLEADADRDGFGDTSQDQCPTDASTQGACATDPEPNAACEKARKKLAKAKTKLEKLKRKDAAAKKLKAAKKKVKKAKAAVKRAC